MMGRLERKEDRKGFSLVELLLAVFILCWTIGGVLLLFVISMISSELAWDTTVATSHAEHVLEHMQTYDSLDEVRGVDWAVWVDQQDLDFLPNEEVNVSFVNIKENLIDVYVTSRWKRKDRYNEVVLKTKITR